jgi:membrane protein
VSDAGDEDGSGRRQRHGEAFVRGASSRAGKASRRGHEWVDRQDPGSRPGVAIEAWRRYQAVDGPLQSALLSLYVLVAVLPALLVIEEYLDPRPDALASRLVRHFGLNSQTAVLLHDVLGDGRRHELGSALFAIAGALFFGLGFGRVLQLVHARAWQLQLPKRTLDQLLYVLVLCGLYGLLFLLLVQLDELRGEPLWVGLLLALVWVGLLVLFFVWAPWLLTQRQLTRRDLLPSAALTALGLVLLMLVSRYVMQFWVNLYAQDYGGLGVVLALYFWIAISSGIIVWAASLSPALATRRDLRRSS